MRVIRSLNRFISSTVILMAVRPVAWWGMRRVRRATRDMRRANYFATRSLRTLMALGLAPLAVTPSGVPAIPPLPPPAR